VLSLHPFVGPDSVVLESALLSFYYPENPLFGREIWSNASAAVFHRSPRAKPVHFPSTCGHDGSGIVFAGFQALGSFPFPLIVAQHDFRFHDRERNAFYQMDVVKLLQHVCGLVSPECAFQLLEVFRSKWYCYPRRRYDFESWYPIVKRLVGQIGTSAEQTRRWREAYPKLLVAERVKPHQLPEYNRRRQALAWLCQKCPGYRLVQDGFSQLGYRRLETACDEAGGFSQLRGPRGIERELIRVLEELTSTILDGFFGDDPPPTCKVIDAEHASWEGMAVTVRLNEPREIRDAFAIRYHLPWVALKKSVFTKDGFLRAFSTYLHERAHCFGGDRSAAFSLALTQLLQITLRHSPEIARAEAMWGELCGKGYGTGSFPNTR
jgi:hypothetical protein